MAFNNITDMPGYEMPIELRTLKGPILGGFSQRPAIPGNLTNYHFLPTSRTSNGISQGSGFGNFFPLMPPFNLGMPIATLFNFDIDGGDGGSGPAVTVTGTAPWISVTGGPNYTVAFNPSDLCNYIDANCTTLGFTDPYFNTVLDQGGNSYSGSTQPSSFGIVGDWVSGSGPGSDTGFIETDINGSNVEILFKRKMWESFYDGSSGRAFPASSADEFQLLGDGTYIDSDVSGGACTYSLDINAVRSATDQNLFSTVAADNGSNIGADSTTDTLTFAYDTDNGDYDNSIVITTDPTTDTVKFKLNMDVVNRSNPATCLVFVGADVEGVSSPPGFSASNTGKKYSATAKVSDFDASNNAVTVTDVAIDLWDMGYSEGQAWVSDASGLYQDDPAPADVTETILLTGNWVLATRIHPAYGSTKAAYVTSYFSRLKTRCATP